MGAMNPFHEQNFFRVRDDTTAADPGTPNWVSTENQSTNVVLEVDTTYRIRFVVSNSGDANGVSDYELYVNKNSTSYAAVTAASSNVQAADASSSADGTALTTANYQLSAGTGTAADGEYSEDGIVSSNLTNGNYFEVEFGITIVSADVADGDTLDFRVYYGGSPMDQYDTNATPRIEVNELTINSGAGDASGTGTATGTGAATAASPGSAAGTGAATGAGESTAAGDGAASGTGTATGVGTGIVETVGSASGTGTATGAGDSITINTGDGAASGTGAATGVGESTAAADGASSGTGAATAVGASTAETVGTSTGTGAATGVGASTAEADGLAAGTGTATAEGATGGSLQSGAGSAAGTGTATGVGGSIAASVGSAAGVGSAAAMGQAIGAAPAVSSSVGSGAAGGPRLRRGGLPGRSIYDHLKDAIIRLVSQRRRNKQKTSDDIGRILGTEDKDVLVQIVLRLDRDGVNGAALADLLGISSEFVAEKAHRLSAKKAKKEKEVVAKKVAAKKAKAKKIAVQLLLEEDDAAAKTAAAIIAKFLKNGGGYEQHP